MFNNSKKSLLSVVAASLIVASSSVLAAFDDAVSNTQPCPINAAYPLKLNSDGTPLGDFPADQVIDAEFGEGAQAITQCLKNRVNAKIVVRVNEAFSEDAFGNKRLNKAMFFSNIEKMINQYENTHGMKIGEKVDIRVVFSGAGAVLATTGHKVFVGAAKKFNVANATAIAAGEVSPLAVSPVNPYKDLVKRGMEVGMHFYLCQEASRTLGITMANKIPGINFVPAAHAATADFQMDGYAIILP